MSVRSLPAQTATRFAPTKTATATATTTATATATTTTATTAATTSLPLQLAPTTTMAPQTPLAPGTVSQNRLEAQRLPPPDGRRFASERLGELATLARLGIPTAVVFDLDNTVFDTRHRTLAACRAFDAAHGRSFFVEVEVGQMGIDGRSTAAALGLPEPDASDFVAFWDIFFWTPDNLAHDVPVAEMVDLARQAQDAGIPVQFLTGRIASFQQASLLQLRAAGVDVSDDAVVCKPDLTTRTGPFKSEQLSVMAARGIEIGFFVTEGSRDLTHLATTVPSVPLLRLACSFEADAGLGHLPTWPAPF